MSNYYNIIWLSFCASHVATSWDAPTPMFTRSFQSCLIGLWLSNVCTQVHSFVVRYQEEEHLQRLSGALALKTTVPRRCQSVEMSYSLWWKQISLSVSFWSRISSIRTITTRDGKERASVFYEERHRATTLYCTPLTAAICIPREPDSCTCLSSDHLLFIETQPFVVWHYGISVSFSFLAVSALHLAIKCDYFPLRNTVHTSYIRSANVAAMGTWQMQWHRKT